MKIGKYSFTLNNTSADTVVEEARSGRKAGNDGLDAIFETMKNEFHIILHRGLFGKCPYAIKSNKIKIHMYECHKPLDIGCNIRVNYKGKIYCGEELMKSHIGFN
jgi:hypothetical protein